MKNAIIVVLVLALGVVGYKYYVKEAETASPSTKSQTNNSPPDDPKTSAEQKPANTVNSSETIDLSGKSLGAISKDILDNSKIKTLNVSNNILTGSLPAEIRKLTNLETLDASNNKLTGIPAEIGQLSKLINANFANNDISGLPQEIGNLKNLKVLDLRGNPNISKFDLDQITSKIPNTKILTD